MKFQTFLGERCRLGVADGIAEIGMRIPAGYGTTAIVIPPRVGKTSLMRQAAIEYVETGLIGGAVILVPWVFLRDQVNNDDKIADMARYHGMDEAPLRVPLIRHDGPERGIDHNLFRSPPPPHWVTLTMGQALAATTRAALVDIALQFKSENRPLLVFIDEGHMTSSGPDGWGKLAKELKDAGAHIVLLTGTPERSDNTAPFGFDVVERSRRADTYWAIGSDETGERKLNKYMSDLVLYDLKAQVNVPLSEAWRNEVLTKIMCREFAFKIDGEDSTSDGISDSDARRGLAVAMRDPEVVVVGIRLMLDELALFWKTVPDIAAIVFVGNDREDDPEKDYECRNVRRTILREWKGILPRAPNVKIATMSDDGGKSAKTTIENFCAGSGDILIVKQMGGVGLDSGRLKVKLDLSTFMTYSGRKQRELRVATPYNGIDHGTSIFPATKLTLEMFRKIVSESGGQYIRENISLLESKPLGEGVGATPREVLITEPERHGSTDMDFRRVENTLDLQVDDILTKAAWLAVRLTRREIADMIEAGITHQDVCGTRPASEVPPQTHVLSKASEVNKSTDKIDGYCRALASRHAQYANGGADDDWVKTYRIWMSRAKVHAEITCELKMCRDMSKLARAEAFLDRHLQSTQSNDAA